MKKKIWIKPFKCEWSVQCEDIELVMSVRILSVSKECDFLKVF